MNNEQLEAGIKAGHIVNREDVISQEKQQAETQQRLATWLDEQRQLATVEAKVNVAAFSSGTEQPVKIRMHHGAVVEIGRHSAVQAIERGDATLVEG